MNTTEGAAYGAALMATVGAGVYDDLATIVNQAVKITGTDSPKDDVAIYDQYYQVYRNLYPTLQEQFVAISKL